MEWKNVRIFISSTFNDMHAERDYLVKHVFPELSEWCEERKLRLIDIDLRWGVTAEDSQNNHTVYACLHNIDESRPFFLCFLGQRRGWVPGESDLSSDTLKSYPGLSAHVGRRSITEMEVEHALLSPMMKIADDIEVHPEAVSHALFFMRDDNYIAQINEAQLPVFTNSSDPDPEESDRRLSEFKDFIRARWSDVYDYWGEWDPDELSPELSMIPGGADEGRLGRFTSDGRPLSEVITEALKREIEAEFPDHVPSTDQTELERDIELQTFFAEQNCMGYIERAGDFDLLRHYVDGDSRGIMVVAAPAGQGKTSLLSKFSSDLRKRGGVRVISRSCGVTDMCSSVHGVFGSILMEAGCSVPTYEESLIRNIGKVLAELADNDEKTVVIIDAVNQLPRGAEIFRWMPRVLPEGLRLIFSVKEDEGSRGMIAHLESEENTVVGHIRPFGRREDKEAVIDAYLSNYLKKLDEEQIDSICSLPESDNPLYLKVILSELRVFGTFRLLSDEIRRFGSTVTDAFNAVLERLENDMDHCEVPSEEYVPLLFGLLAASRAGLSEEELLTCIRSRYPGADKEGLAEAFHIYFRQLRSFMTRREGRWDFFYESFRIAAEERYAVDAQGINRLLYDCFADIISDKREGRDLHRAYSEAAWHLYQSDREGSVPGDEACSLLLSAEWIEGKLYACGADSLLEDYNCISEESCPEELLYMRRALRASVHILRERPLELAHQLNGRLRDVDGSRIRDLLADLAGRMEYSWLEPLGQTLTGPLDARAVTLSGHSADITDAVFCCGYVCTGDADGIVRIWDMDNWQCLRVLPAHNKMDVRFVRGSLDLITWASEDDLTIYKKWDVFSGTLLTTAALDKRITRAQKYRDMVIGLDFHDVVCAHRLTDLSRVTDTDAIGLPEGYADEYEAGANQTIRETGAHVPAKDYEIYAQGSDAVVLRKDVTIERQSDLPVSIIEPLPDGGWAACGTHGYDGAAEDEDFARMFGISIYGPDGEKLRFMSVPRLSRMAVCGRHLIYSHSKEGQFIYYGRNEVIHFCDIENDFREEKAIETLAGYFTDENGDRKRILLGTGEILSMVMINDDLFCIDTISRLLVVRKGSSDFEWRNFEKPWLMVQGDKQRIFRLGDQLGYIGGLSRENPNKDRYKTVFRLYDPETLEMTSEKYLEEIVAGAVFSEDLAVLICNREGDSILVRDGDAYVSVRDSSLAKEYYTIEADNSVIDATDYQIGKPLEKGGFSLKSRYGWISVTTHPENHVILSDGYLFISSGNKVMQLDAKTGNLIAEAEGEDLYFMGIALSGDTLLAGTSTGKVFRYGIRHGEKGNIASQLKDHEADGYEFFVTPEEDEEYFSDIALNELDSEKRLEALDHIDDQEVLRKVLEMDDAPAVRAGAAGRITDQSLLVDRALEDPSEVVCKAAITAVTDQDELNRYITSMISSRRRLLTDAFEDAVSRCEDDRVLYEVCMIEHDRYWKKSVPAKRIRSYEYQYALICDHRSIARDYVIEGIDPDYEGSLPKAFIDRTMVYEETNFVANRALMGCSNVRLIMLQYLRHRGETMADLKLEYLKSAFPKKYENMDYRKRGEYLIGCMEEAARAAEKLLPEDERVRALLPDDIPIDSSVLYAAIAMYSPDQVKRLLAASHLPEEAGAFVGPRTLYNDVRIFLSRRLNTDRSIEEACFGRSSRYEGIAGSDQLGNPELKENFLNLLRVNARYDSHKEYVEKYMEQVGLTRRPPADWPVTGEGQLEELLASPDLDKGLMLAAIMLQHGSGCYDDSILIKANAVTAGMKDPEFLKELICDPLTDTEYAKLFMEALDHEEPACCSRR